MVLVFASFSGKGGKIAFKNDARLKHLPGLEAVKSPHPTEGRLAEIRRAIGNKGSNSVPDLHDSHGCEIPNAGTETGPAYLERAGKFALRWDLVAGLQHSLFNQRANVVDHFHGSVDVGRIVDCETHIVQNLLEISIFEVTRD
jgi:hypothetical protein